MAKTLLHAHSCLQCLKLHTSAAAQHARLRSQCFKNINRCNIESCPWRKKEVSPQTCYLQTFLLLQTVLAGCVSKKLLSIKTKMCLKLRLRCFSASSKTTGPTLCTGLQNLLYELATQQVQNHLNCVLTLTPMLHFSTPLGSPFQLLELLGLLSGELAQKYLCLLGRALPTIPRRHCLTCSNKQNSSLATTINLHGRKNRKTIDTLALGQP